MQLVRLKLRNDCPFFFLGPINLNPDNRISEAIDFDDIPSNTKDVILNAHRMRDISIVREEDGQALVVVKGQDKVDLGDVTPESELEVVSLVPEPKNIIYTEKHLASARTLLDKNGNAVRAILKSMQPTKDNLKLLSAAKQVEQEDRNRIGVLQVLQEATENMEQQLSGQS